jgi:hypothetical protein
MYDTRTKGLLMRSTSVGAALVAVLCYTILYGTPRCAFPQVEEVLRRLEGERTRPLTVSHAACAQLPRPVVQVRDRDDPGSIYAGVLLRDMLALAGVPLVDCRDNQPLPAAEGPLRPPLATGPRRRASAGWVGGRAPALARRGVDAHCGGQSSMQRRSSAPFQLSETNFSIYTETQCPPRPGDALLAGTRGGNTLPLRAACTRALR